MDNWFQAQICSISCAAETGIMGTWRKNRKGVSAEIKSAELKKGEHVSVCKDRLMKWKNEKDICLINFTHDIMVQLGFKGKNWRNPE
jgi:hypothetical protein